MIVIDCSCFSASGHWLFGFLAAWLLPARIDGYDHLTDAISVIGRESATRSAYIVAAIVGWGGMQLFGAVVRKFVPGAQVLTWMFGWFGWLWLMAAVFPICADVNDGVGTTCDSTMAELGSRCSLSVGDRPRRAVRVDAVVHLQTCADQSASGV